MQVHFALLQELAERRRAQRQTESEKIEGGERDDRAAQDERQESQRGHHGVWKHVPEHDHQVAGAKGARRPHVVEIAGAQELGADHPDQSHPAEQQQEPQEPPEIGLYDGGQDDQQVEQGDAFPNFNEALEDEVDPAAEVALDGARGDPDDAAEHRQRQAEQHRNPESVNQPGDHVTRLVVGPQPIPGGGRRGGRRRQAEHRGVVAVGNERPDDPALRLDQVLDEGIAVVGLGLEFTAEFRLGIGLDHGRVKSAVVVNENRLVVGDEFREQADEEQREEGPQRPETAPVGPEIHQPPGRDRGDVKTQETVFRHDLRPLGFRNRSWGRRRRRPGR